MMRHWQTILLEDSRRDTTVMFFFSIQYRTRCIFFYYSVTEHTDDYSAAQHHFQARSPSASLAMDMGTDSHKLQLMKASFFADDDYDGKSIVSEQLEGRDSPDQIVPNRPGTRSHLYSVASSMHSQSRGLPSTISSVLEIPVTNLIVPSRDMELRTIENQVKFHFWFG